MYNKLDRYRKILNLRDINDIISMFDNSTYLDFEYDKYLYNPDIKKHYLSEKSVAKNVSRELELAFIKDKYNIFYDLYYNLFQPTIYYTEQTNTLRDGNIVVISGLVNEDDEGTYYLDISGGTYTLLDQHDGTTAVSVTDFTGAAYLKIGDYTYIVTAITSDVITLEDGLTSSMYDYTTETAAHLETRLTDTAEYRKLFLRYIPNFEVFKGTQKYIEFVAKFYYLIKYWDIDEISTVNLANADIATTISEGDITTNFVYYITSLIPKTEWDLYIKPCVHPHGWIDMYFEVTPDNNILQAEFNSKENKPTYTDVLLSTNNNILRSVSTVKKFGNLETRDDYSSIGVDPGTLTIAGRFITYKFGYYDSDNEKVAVPENNDDEMGTYVTDTTFDYNFTIPPPQFSFDSYTYTDEGAVETTILQCLYTVADSDLPVSAYVVYNLSCYDIDILLVDDPEYTGTMSIMEDSSNGKAYYSTATIPISGSTAFSNSFNESTLYIQTIIYETSTSDVIVAKSDIVSFEIMGEGRTPGEGGGGGGTPGEVPGGGADPK